MRSPEHTRPRRDQQWGAMHMQQQLMNNQSGEAPVSPAADPVAAAAAAEQQEQFVAQQQMMQQQMQMMMQVRRVSRPLL